MTSASRAAQSSRPVTNRRKSSLLAVPVVLMTAITVGVACVAYLLWPTWSGVPVALDAPALPVTVAGVLFDVPPAAIRAAVQRHPGPHERIDLAFLWPSLLPPPVDTKATDQLAVTLQNDSAAAPTDASARVFLSIAPLGAVLAPAERLRSIYTHYVEKDAMLGPDGLAILPFRAGSPYEGEDLIYVANNPEQFFARCTRQIGAVPGTCIHERLIGAAEVTLRFPRAWLEEWRDVNAGFDRLMAQLHPQGN
jgi:hypothetical protein